MKNILVTLLILLANFAWCQNLIKNPDFEEIETPQLREALKKYFQVTECPKEWTVNPSAPSKYTVMMDAESAHSGSCYLRMEQLDTAKSCSCVQWWTKLKGSQKYRQSIWAKGKGQIIVFCIPYSTKKKVLPRIGMSKLVELTEQWKEYSVEFETTADTDTAIVSFHGRGVVEVDDASLIPIAK